MVEISEEPTMRDTIAPSTESTRPSCQKSVLGKLYYAALKQINITELIPTRLARRQLEKEQDND
jgi:hypothetical protein